MAWLGVCWYFTTRLVFLIERNKMECQKREIGHLTIELEECRYKMECQKRARAAYQSTGGMQGPQWHGKGNFIVWYKEGQYTMTCSIRFIW